MIKSNKKIIIYLIILTCLPLKVSEAKTWYFDSISGNDSTAQPDNIYKPYKTLPILNWLLSNKSILSGDVVAFKKGNFEYEQFFSGFVAVGPSANTNIRFTSYGEGNFKPILSRAFEITGWSGGPNVYTKNISSCTNLLENRVPLKSASNSSCTDGYWYFDSVTKTLYYKPSDGIFSGKYIESGGLSSFIASNFSNIIIDGLYFYTSFCWIAAENNSCYGITVSNCDFSAGACLSIRSISYNNISNINVIDNMFKNSCGPSVYLSTNDNLYRSGLDNIYFARNKITANNMLPGGSIWTNRVGDRDIIYGQNWGTTIIEDNEFEGDTGVNDYSATIQCYQANCFSFTIAITGLSNNGSGLFRVTYTGTPNPKYPPANGDHVFIYGISGAGAPNGKWKLAGVDNVNKTFDLVDSSYVSGCSGGNWYTDYPFNADITIRRNIIRNGRNGVYMGSSNSGALETNKKYKIYNNVIVNQSGYGIKIDLPTIANSSYIYNNTLHNCVRGIEMALNTKNILIKNNIISNSSTLFAKDNYMGNIWDYNCYFNASIGNVFQWGSTTQNWSTWHAARDIHSLVSNPNFANMSESYTLPSDFRLKKGSPCITNGTNVGLTKDYQGNGFRQPPSMGAFEYYNIAGAISPWTVGGTKYKQ